MIQNYCVWVMIIYIIIIIYMVHLNLGRYRYLYIRHSNVSIGTENYEIYLLKIQGNQNLIKT